MSAETSYYCRECGNEITTGDYTCLDHPKGTIGTHTYDRQLRGTPAAARYHPAYDAGPDEATNNSVQVAQDAGAVELAEVIDNCRNLGVGATLKDEAGFTRGWVKSDGTYRLQ